MKTIAIDYKLATMNIEHFIENLRSKGARALLLDEDDVVVAELLPYPRADPVVKSDDGSDAVAGSGERSGSSP